MTAPRFCLLVCDGPSCGVTHDSDRLLHLAQRTVAERAELRERVAVRNYTCFGRCDDGPNVFVLELPPGGDPNDDPSFESLETQRGFYPGIDAAKLARVIDGHCTTGDPLADLVEPY